ncbi:DinB family protein [Bacillus sp. NTK074B]|uniref:DinB family protein n=1 Tax=Bacillus sp. NTK074B TaxID=2802174 RepID=UPI001A8D78AB|nr:DinB family protein [Bacillus sp. NTK074B]
MNIYCQNVLHQIEIAVLSIMGMMDTLTDKDLTKRPTSSRHSVGELLSHISLICGADALIAAGAGQQEMEEFYSSKTLNSLDDIKDELLHHFSSLKEGVGAMTDEMLTEETTSYWGVTYTRFEWLVEIVAHLYHHRGQLHAMLVHCIDRDPQVQLFE